MRERVFRQRSNRLHQRERDVCANDRRGVQQPFVVLGESINTRGQDRLHSCWDLNGWKFLCKAIRTQFTNKYLGLNQRPHTLFQEKGIALCSLDEKLFKSFQAGIGSEQSLKKLVGTLRR